MILRKGLRRQGLGKAVSRRLMADLVFGQLGLRRLYGGTLETHVAALRVAERLGAFLAERIALTIGRVLETEFRRDQGRGPMGPGEEKSHPSSTAEQ